MLTIKQVEKGATTPKKALELSIKHWWENVCLKKEEVPNIEGTHGDYSPTSAKLCGLCIYHRHFGTEEELWDCPGCPIKDKCEDDSLYESACSTLCAFDDEPTEENYQAWRKAARAMHKYLCSLRSTV